MARGVVASSLASGLAMAVLLSGCAASKHRMDAYNANQPNISSRDVGAYANDMYDFGEALRRIAEGEHKPLPKVIVGTDRDSSAPEANKPKAAALPNNDYRPMVDAGLMYVDVRCERYMDALFWFNRAKDGADRQLGYFGAASGAALKVVEASSALIALAPLGFKLATETINNVGKGMLYNLSPGAVRSIVVEQQLAFKKAIENDPYRSRARALQVVQAYLSICLPASIEMQIEDAVTKAKFQEKVEPPGKADATVKATATTDGKTKAGTVDAAAGVTPPADDKTTSGTGAVAGVVGPGQPLAGQQTLNPKPPAEGNVPLIVAF